MQSLVDMGCVPGPALVVASRMRSLTRVHTLRLQTRLMHRYSRDSASRALQLSFNGLEGAVELLSGGERWCVCEA